jgi:hypothetical protein
MKSRIKIWALGAAAVLPMAVLATVANSAVPAPTGTIFSDNFQAAGTFADNTNWVTHGSGYYFPGSGSGSQALGLANRTEGGDVIGGQVAVVAGHLYTLSTDYATDGDPGFIGVKEYDSTHALSGEQWVLGGDSSASPLATLPTTNVWGTYSHDFRPDAGTAYVAMEIEDFDQGTPGPAAAQAFFDNVSISTANATPTASGGSATTNQDTAKALTLTGNDADKDALTFAVTQPSHGAVALTGSPSCDGLTGDCTSGATYTPTAGYHGPDSFTFTVSDGFATSAPAVVTLNVDNAPVAVNDSYRTGRDVTLTTTTVGAGVLGNDTDANNDVLTATLVTPTMAGSTLTLNPNGTFTYAPKAGYRGPDSFTYTASDGSRTSNIGTANITVNSPPVAVADGPYAGTEGQTLNVTSGVGVGLLANDTDGDGDTLTAVLVSPPAHGTVTVNPNGSFAYKPATNYIGNDAFSYKAFDGIDYSNAAAVSLTVAYDGIPDATSINYNGPGSVKKGSSFTAKANLSSSDPACLAGRGVTFNGFGGTLYSGTTNSSGAVSVTVPGSATATWAAGNYVVTVTTPAVAEPGSGGGQCASGSTSQKFKVTK